MSDERRMFREVEERFRIGNRVVVCVAETDVHRGHAKRAVHQN